MTAKHWEQKLSRENSSEVFDIVRLCFNNEVEDSTEMFQDGVYDLVSYSDSYEDYLSALGAPWYALPLILAGSESMEIEATEEGARMVITTSKFF